MRVQVTFLGSGAAVTPNAYNASILIDHTILLDAGAPLSVHLPRAGVRLDEPQAVLLSHFHADHTFGIAWLILGRLLLYGETAPLHVLGPRGTEGYLRQLLDLAWGQDMRSVMWERVHLTVRELEAGDHFEVDGSEGQAYQMTHTPNAPCLGFLLERDGVRLGYTGDAELSDQLKALINASDHVIIEMTTDEPGPLHLSRVEIEGLVARHPQVRFILTHRGTDAGVKGALAAHDFLSLRLPLR